jgi:SAM-dependent methyltransferase
MTKDLFSNQAALYANYRPGYPGSLIDYVLSFVQDRICAWDCATGNGQAALLLAPYFQRVEATDISRKQIDHAVQHPSIVYSVEGVEGNGFPDNAFDLITVAQAYHWFNFDTFLREARRTGKKGSVVAVWGYGLVQTSDPDLQNAIDHFYVDIVGKYWDPERKYIDEKYETVPFHFKPLPSKNFAIEMLWNPTDFIGYLNTWSSVQHFIKANGNNPVDEFAKTMTTLWKENNSRRFSFPLFLRIGTVEK